MRTTTVVLLLGLVSSLGSCQGLFHEAPAPDTLTEVQARRAILVGVSDFAPWVMVDKHGKRMGFEIDVATKLAADLGVDLETVPLAWERLIPELEEGRIDLIASGMSITPARSLIVNFSNPYHHSVMTILANLVRAPELKTRMDFDKRGMRVAVVKGTTSEATAHWALPQATIITFETQKQMVGAVRDGQTHAAVASTPTPRLAMLRFPGDIYVPLEQPLARTAEAFAIRKGDADFLAYLNAWIAARKVDGWLERRQAYWFHSIGWEDRL